MVTRLSVELLPNREPSDDRSPRSTDTDDGSDASDTDMVELDNSDNRHKLRKIKSKILDLTHGKRKALNAVRSAEFRLEILETYMRGTASNMERSEIFLQDGMKVCQEERETALRDILEWKIQVEKIDEEIVALQKPKDRLRKRVTRERNKVINERATKKERIRKERSLHSPDKAYAVIINIDVEAAFDGDEGLAHNDGQTYICDLALSYATGHASWTPIYDMTLSTATSSGTLYFDALMRNQTSETWDDCNIVLSTWEPTFSCPDDHVPALRPWFVRLLPSQLASANNEPIPDENGHFLAQTTEGFMFCHAPLPPSCPISPSKVSVFEDDDAIRDYTRRSTPGPENRPPESDDSFSGCSSPSPMGNHDAIRGQTSQVRQQNFFCDEDYSTADDRPTIRKPLGTLHEYTPSLGEGGGVGGDSATVHVPLTTINESKKPDFKKTELMATYGLVERKSLAPSFKYSRHRVARIPLSDVNFSRITVPKDNEAVFLNAQLPNSSNFTLPPGPSELTLDGRYVGQVDLPSWRRSDTCTLELGVDPWIRVFYHGPKDKHNNHSMTPSVEGGGSALFTQTIILVNTRDETEGGPVEVTVLDQMPISNDRNLEFARVTPACLGSSGSNAFTGEPSGDIRSKTSWGREERKFKQGGEVEWAITINPRCTAKLSLEYSCNAKYT